MNIDTTELDDFLNSNNIRYELEKENGYVKYVLTHTFYTDRYYYIGIINDLTIFGYDSKNNDDSDTFYKENINKTKLFETIIKYMKSYYDTDEYYDNYATTDHKINITKNIIKYKQNNLTQKYPNGTWYLELKKLRAQLWKEKNNQIYNRESRIWYYNNFLSPEAKWIEKHSYAMF